MWETARATNAFQAAIRDATTYRRGIVRLFGIPESEIANTLRAAEAAHVPLEQLEITTCLRRGEIEVATRYEPPGQRAYDELIDFIAQRHADTLYSRDGSTVDDQVATLLRGHRLAVAESCTGGLFSARITDVAGSSDYFAGGAVVYSNEAKSEVVGVDPALIDRVGAVSVEVAEALADGAIDRFDANLGIGITGIAGPGGGTEEKPVGLVCFSVAARGADGTDPPGQTAPMRPWRLASPAAPVCPAIAPTSATARPRWPCTCCAACSRARATAHSPPARWISRPSVRDRRRTGPPVRRPRAA